MQQHPPCVAQCDVILHSFSGLKGSAYNRQMLSDLCARERCGLRVEFEGSQHVGIIITKKMAVLITLVIAYLRMCIEVHQPSVSVAIIRQSIHSKRIKGRMLQVSFLPSESSQSLQEKETGLWA